VTHTDPTAVGFQQIGVIVGRVMAAAIGMVHQAGAWLSLLEGHTKRLKRQIIFSRVQSSAQPIARYDSVSMTTAAYTNFLYNQISVMSPTQSQLTR
jgi:hypothetical protein